MPYIKSGKLRALAVTSSKRIQQLPDVPTVIEAGIDAVRSTPEGLAAWVKAEVEKWTRAAKIANVVP